ncbi:MAG TPA: acetoacetate--CoA ligase [Bryobacteraceae bacterium]|nr:acetoacetate--CoA ligase [Bryobacteraceae bacterium]
MQQKPLWEPSLERRERTNLTSFLRESGFSDYESLHCWSVNELDAFWKAVWKFSAVIGEMGKVAFDPGEAMRSNGFFPDAKLNVAENLLWSPGGESAIVAIGEDGARYELSWDELRCQVFSVAGALRSAGVLPGDRVAASLPLVPEAVVLLLATSAIGAIFSSTSPDFGAAGVLDRFGQIEPKVLVATTGYRYGGKWFDCVERLRDIRRGLPSVTEIVIVKRELRDVRDIPDAHSWETWIRSADPVDSLEDFPFDHPWLVLFSSGTTGKPKCIVHRTGGVFLNLKKEHVLHCDVKSGDRVLYFTTTGWMMFNWLVNVLAAGATAVLVDGNPFYPDPTRLLDIADRERITLLGVSAKFIDELRKTGFQPCRSHSFDHLRTICSTGSPLSPESFSWVYSDIKRDVHLASISGGTDICGCFLLGSPIEPVYAGELQRPGLGMAMDVWDENGRTLRDQPGARGELVCVRPFPSQPLAFWGDADGQHYCAAYFEKYPGVWAHGDFASWTSHGGMIIHGRSDATLNPGGVRIGTAELYRIVEQIPSVLEALVFGQQWKGDVRIVLLVRLAPGVIFDHELEAEIRQRIRSSYTPRHVPAVILAVDDLPRTRSNKLVELAVSDFVNGREVRNIEAIANPEALWAIFDRPELKA